jgi:hypothetical protein
MKVQVREAATFLTRYPRTSIAVLLTVLLLYPPIYGLYCFGMKTVFGYFADDAFYYLTVAKNSTLGFFTFDGEKPTNGFHPLWQFVLVVLSGVVGRHDLVNQLYATYLLGALLTTAGFVLIGWSLYRVTGSVFWPLWLIPGPFYMLFTIKGVGNEIAHGVTYTFCPWAFMNGMESPCSVLACGLFLVLLTRTFFVADQSPANADSRAEVSIPSDARLVALGLSVSLLVMARLDDIFLLFTTALFLLCREPRGSRGFRGALLVVLPSLVLLTAYLAFNYSAGQSLLPISGKVKSTGAAALTGNIAMALCDLFPPLHGLIRPSYSLQDWSITAVRSSALILPVAFAVWFALYLFRSRSARPDVYRRFQWLLPLLFYMVLKGLYNLVNVRLGSQGYWYHALPILMTNYMAILVCWHFIPRESFQRFSVLRLGSIGLYVFVYLFTSANMIFSGSFANDRCYPLWQNRVQISSDLKKMDPSIKLIDRSDGAFAYCLDIPAVCALGYAIDYDGYVALKNGKFLDYCVGRGFDVTFEGPHSYAIDKADYEFRKIYEDKMSGNVFFRIEPPASRDGRTGGGRVELPGRGDPPKPEQLTVVPGNPTLDCAVTGPR